MTEQGWILERGPGPVVATAIHHGHDLRSDVSALMILPEAERLREEDPFTGEIAAVAPTRAIVMRSRFEVDLNRPRERAVYRVPDDCWGLEVWASPPPQSLVDESLGIYDAFYETMDGMLGSLEAEFGSFVVLDVHSYNHRRAGPDSSPDDAVGNPEINLGTGTMERARWSRLVDRFIGDLRSAEASGRRLDVRENIRFRGGHLSKWVHERFPESGCALAVEFKKTFMDEWTGVPDEEAIAGLRDALGATIPGLVEELGRG